MECDVILDYLRERGISGSRKNSELVIAPVGSLQLGFWCPRDDFPNIDDIEDAKRVLGLDNLDVLIVVSYRPYVLIDFLNSLIERANRWYGLQFNVKLLGVSSVELETGLEDALGRAFVEKPHKLSPGVKSEYICPQCGKDPLYLYREERYFSRKYRGRVVERIYACISCGFRARKIDLID